RVDAYHASVQSYSSPAAFGQPELFGELAAQFGGPLPQPARQRELAEGLGQFGTRQQGGVHIALHLAQCDRRLGQMPLGIVDAVVAVLPALVDQAAVGGAPVLDETVAVAIAVMGDPLDRRVGGGQQRADGLLVRSEEHTSELQSRENLVCRLLLEKKKDTRP